MKGMSFSVASAIFMQNRLNLFLKQENKEESVCAARIFKEVREDSGSVLHNTSFERAQRAPAGPAALRNK